MKSKSLIVAGGAGLIGLAVFFLVQLSDVSVGEHGVEVKVGMKTAQAGCFQDGPNCLPQMDFIDTEGAVWTPELLAGKVVVVNFWATWCKPCQHEVPDLSKINSKYKDKDVIILGLMTDEPSEEQLEAFATRFGLNYPVVRVNYEIAEAFGQPTNLPTNFVYDRSGALVFDRPGAISAKQLESELKQLL